MILNDKSIAVNFNPESFLRNFRDSLDATLGRDPIAKTYNADDTLRVFEAADKACKAQPEYFPKNGKSYWNRIRQEECKESMREFLCDYTYHDSHSRVLLSLESEWGVLASPIQTTAAVTFDFKKIINMASPVKVMVFAYVRDGEEGDKKKSLEGMSNIIREWPQDVLGTLMAISCPWHDTLCGDTVKGYLWSGTGWKDIS